MIRVKFTSSYTETDRCGNQRRWQNSVEAQGSGSEVNRLLGNLMSSSRLPGINPLLLSRDVNQYLLDE